jgi:hypothetical protein
MRSEFVALPATEERTLHLPRETVIGRSLALAAIAGSRAHRSV